MCGMSGYSEDGTEYILEDDAAVGDKVTRCGVGPLSLSPDSEWTPSCAGHDFAYGSIRYMQTHTRSETDRARSHGIATNGDAGGW